MAQLSHLSKRERDVVELLLEGKSNKQIAAALHITENTVEFHFKNIYRKYQVSSRTELILQLGKSVVADTGETAENRDKPADWMRWASSLVEAVSRIGKELRMDEFAVRDENNMTFYEAIRVCLTKYADFNGQASRAEFWWFALFVTLAATAFTYISQSLGNVFLITMLLPLLAAGARRLRESGKSAWWLLFLLVPVAGIVLVGILWALPAADSLPEKTVES